MPKNNRVVWSEGLFLRPEHLQQQERFFERLVELRSSGLRPHAWGLTRLELNQELLGIGKFAVASAQGVLPDGTPFSIPDDDLAPPPVDIPTTMRDQLVYLALPLHAPRRLEFSYANEALGLTRYVVDDFETTDATNEQTEPVVLQVGAIGARLLLSGQSIEDYACIPIAKVQERRADGRIALDSNFIPTVLIVGAAPRLDAFLTELSGMLRQRGDALAGRISDSGRGGSSEIADFLFLMLVNRVEPLIAHLSQQHLIHPHELFGVLASLAGELATLTSPRRRPGATPTYRHEDLRASFEPLFQAIRKSLGAVLEQNAVAIPLEQKKFVHIGVLTDRTLLSGAVFVLAVRADVAAEEVRKRLPMQIKIGPVEKIRDLVRLQLPGIEVAPLPVAPRQLPYHAGAIYFELNGHGEMWQAMQSSGGFAIHLGVEYPGLILEFWAIRGGR
jgi:type VI secretion system protein ImpJ